MITSLIFPNHTLTVERIIKIVTDTSKRVVRKEARYGYVRAKIEGRKKLPKFESKI